MSDFRYPARVQHALLPTRIERLVRYSATLPGVEVWIKRDDLTGFLLSGNKIRKLEFIFAAAMAQGVDGVITCGGWNSNHCRATAALAARLGLECHLFLRTPDGQPMEPRAGNTLLDVLLGAQLYWVTPEEYTGREELMMRHAQQMADAGRSLYVIPEGGSDATGALGYVLAVEEIEEQLRTKNLRIDVLVHAIGSGGTTAGLTAGRAHHGASWRILGIPVCDDADYFRGRVSNIRADLATVGLPEETPDEPVEILDGYQGAGYGLTTPEELAWIRAFCRLEGILLDPCYTGKAFHGLHREILAGRFAPGTRILLLHTGGGFSNFAYPEWQDASAD